MFWFLTLCLLLLACTFVVVPLRIYSRNSEGGSQNLSRKEINVAIFEERHYEMELELANGNLDIEQFEELRLELQRSLLADVSDDSSKVKKHSRSKQPQSFFRRHYFIPLCLVLLMPVTAYSLYNQWGSINQIVLSDLFKQTMSVGDDSGEIRDLIMNLGEVVKGDPENGWAWYFLARNLTTVGLYEMAADAFRSASDIVEHPADKAVILGQYAQALYLASDREFTGQVKEIIAAAQAINPNDMSVLQLLSSEALANAQYQQAIGYWRRMLQLNPRSESADFLRQSIAMAQGFLGESPSDSGATSSSPGAAASGPEIEIHLTLAEGLNLPSTTRIFVSAKAASGPPMPLAAKDLYVGDLPATIVLNNAAAIGPMNLSSFDTVNVSATASASGTSNVQSGDYRVTSANFAHANQRTVIELVIKSEDLIP